MHIRDQEIKRLEQYAKGLGLKVEYRPARRGYNVGAEIVSIEGVSTQVILYTHSRMSKTMLVLNFLHELGHHLSWIYKNRKDDPALLEALYAEGNRKPNDPPIPKAQRKLIYLMEKEDAEYRHFVALEVGIKISEKRQALDKAIDLYGYHYYYAHGEHPTQKQVDKFILRYKGGGFAKEKR